MGERLLYAFPSDVPKEDLDTKKSSLSDNTDWPGLINDELSDSMAFYYGDVISTDERIWGNFLEYIYLCWGGKESRGILRERIFTTGLKQGVYSCYGKSF